MLLRVVTTFIDFIKLTLSIFTPLQRIRTGIRLYKVYRFRTSINREVKLALSIRCNANWSLSFRAVLIKLSTHVARCKSDLKPDRSKYIVYLQYYLFSLYLKKLQPKLPHQNFNLSKISPKPIHCNYFHFIKVGQLYPISYYRNDQSKKTFGMPKVDFHAELLWANTQSCHFSFSNKFICLQFVLVHL